MTDNITPTDTYIPRGEWPNRTRAHGWAPIPYGYKADPTSDTNCIPDVNVIKILEDGMDFLDQHKTYREVADWLTIQLNETISHQTVSNLWHRLRGSDPTNPRAMRIAANIKKRKPLTKAEEAARQLNYKIGAAKRTIVVGEKKKEKYAKLKEDKEKVVNPNPFIQETNTQDLSTADPTEGKIVVFRPNPGPQTEFLAANEREILYGGAGGGFE